MKQFVLIVVFLLSTLSWHVATSATVTPSERVVFFALGDQGSGSRHQRRVANAMEWVAAKTGGLDFVLLLGDNFYNSGVASINDSKWRSRFEDIYDGAVLAKTPFYAILGNHDIRSNPQAQVAYGQLQKGSKRWHMEGRNYVLNYGQTPSGDPLLRMALMDTSLPVEQMSAFVRQVFTQEAGKPVWRLAAGHYPLRSSGAHGDTAELVSGLLPTLNTMGVKLFLSGHDHDMELIRAPKEPVQIVSGAGGKSLYPLGYRTQWSEFIAQRYGFVRVVVTTKALEITFFDDRETPLYQTSVHALVSGR